MSTGINVLIVGLGVAAAVVTLVAFLKRDLPRRIAWVVVGVAMALGTFFGLVALNRQHATEMDAGAGGHEPTGDETANLANGPRQASLGAAHGESPVSLTELISDLEGESLTDLQKSQLVRRLRGHKGQWKVVVHNVRRSFESDPQSQIHLVFSPYSEKDDNTWNIAVAVFPAEAEPDLAPLGGGDEALIEGVLDFNELGGRWSPVLTQSRLLTYRKGKGE